MGCVVTDVLMPFYVTRSPRTEANIALAFNDLSNTQKNKKAKNKSIKPPKYLQLYYPKVTMIC